MHTPYEVLGVRRNADDAAIQAALRRAVKLYHPDLNPGDATAAQRYERAISAYKMLSKPSQRAAYDAYLRQLRGRKVRRLAATAIMSAGIVSSGGLALALWLSHPQAPPTAELRIGIATSAHKASATQEEDAGPQRERVQVAESAVDYVNLGIALRGKGDLDAAIAAFGQAIRIEPGLPAAYYNRGLALSDKQDLQRAHADYARAHELMAGPTDLAAVQER